MWNQKIRSYYRDLLSLDTRENTHKVTCKLPDDGSFIRIVEDRYPNLDFAEIVAQGLRPAGTRCRYVGMAA